MGRDVAALKIRFCDEFDGGFGWIVDEFMARCAHVLVAAGRVWAIDPLLGDDRRAGDSVVPDKRELFEAVYERVEVELAERIAADSEPAARTWFSFSMIAS